MMDTLLQYFLVRDNQPTLLLVGSYELWLVALSILVAIFSSSIALQLAGSVRTTSHRIRKISLLGGSIALGAGVWSMHFIGMLAFGLCTPVSFHIALTGLSVLPSLLASWAAFNLLARPRANIWQLLNSSFLVGLGITAMHYTGMAAMNLNALIRYDPVWFAASVGIGLILSFIALWIRFSLSKGGQIRSLYASLLGGVVMGLAISGMHYTAMAATRFVGTPEPGYSSITDNSYIMALAIALAAASLSLLVITSSTVQRLRHQNHLRQRSESRLQAIVDTATEAIITTDTEGYLLSISRSAELMFGWSSKEVQGRHVNLLLPEAQYLQQYLYQQQSNKHPNDLLGQRKDKTTFSTQLVVGQARMPGEVLLVGFISDLSAQKAMERALRASEQQYRSLISNIPGVTFRCNAQQGHLLFISDAIERITGWPAQAFLDQTKSFMELVHPDDRERLLQYRRQYFDQPAYTVEYRVFSRERQERWISERACSVLDTDTQQAWIDGVLIDITDSKKRNAEFEGIVNAIDRAMAVVEFDLNGTILAVNDNYLQLTGYSREELHHQNHTFLCFPEDTRTPSYQKHWQALRQGAFFSGEYRRKTKDHQELWIQATYNPIFDADGLPCKIIKLATDLSERRAMEVDLRSAKEQAEHAALVKSTFLANMSHEIRTPMNSIIGFSELLLDTLLEATQRQHLTIINQAARSLLNLLNAILDTAKLERGIIELECSDFSLHELCQHTLNSIRLDADRKNLALILDYPADLPDYFHSDALRIKQLLLNLLGNAVKFTEQGRVELRVSQTDQDMILLEVIDTGIGIPADRLKGIFDPFAQADASITRRFGGTGLGTTITRQITELLGGVIGVESTEGVGSRFWVSLPLPIGQAPTQIEHIPLELPPLRILVADDVPQNLELLQLLFNKGGHQITTAPNGEEALNHYQEQPFDLVLMDVQMPRMDGLEATRRIRALEQQNPEQPHIPIIALSASVLEADRRAALASGMDDFAFKPVDFPKLQRQIAQVIGIASPHSAQEVTMEQTSSSKMPLLIDWKLGLSLWGDALSLQTRILSLLSSPTADMNHLTELLTQDPTQALAQLHRLRGSAGNLALAAIQTQAGRLEQMLKEGQTESALKAVYHLQKALHATQQAIQNTAVPKPDKTESEMPSGTPQQVQIWLDEVEQALRHGELSEQTLQKLIHALPEDSEPLKTLCTALDNFDFEGAQKALQKLREQLNP